MSTDELVGHAHGTNMWCEHCRTRLCFGEQVVVMYACYAQLQGGRASVEVMRAVDGDYTHEPLMFHQACWDSLLTDIAQVIRGGARRQFRNAVCACSFCNEQIVDAEDMALLTFPSVGVSRDMQSPKLVDRITVDGNPPIQPQCLCMQCLGEIHMADVLDLSDWQDLTCVSDPDDDDEEQEYQRYLAHRE